MAICSGSPVLSCRLIASGVAAGTHVVTLTISASSDPLSSGTNGVFDYLQAALLSDVQTPVHTYPNVSVACDYDTGQTYQVAPTRAQWIIGKAGH